MQLPKHSPPFLSNNSNENLPSVSFMPKTSVLQYYSPFQLSLDLCTTFSQSLKICVPGSLSLPPKYFSWYNFWNVGTYIHDFSKGLILFLQKSCLLLSFNHNSYGHTFKFILIIITLITVDYCNHPIILFLISSLSMFLTIPFWTHSSAFQICQDFQWILSLFDRTPVFSWPERGKGLGNYHTSEISWSKNDESIWAWKFPNGWVSLEMANPKE